MGVNSGFCCTCRNDGCFFHCILIVFSLVSLGSYLHSREMISIFVYLYFQEEDIYEEISENEENSDRTSCGEKQKPDRQDPVQGSAAPYLYLLQKPEHCRTIPCRCRGGRLHLRGREKTFRKRSHNFHYYTTLFSC